MSSFFRFLFGNRSSDLTHDQMKALLDILICMVLADGHQESSELEELANNIKRMNLEDESEIISYVELRKREFSNNLDVKQVFSHAAEQLTEPWMREHAYYLAAKIANADSEVHAGETEALHYLTAALDIPREKMRLITQRLIQEDGL